VAPAAGIGASPPRRGRRWAAGRMLGPWRRRRSALRAGRLQGANLRGDPRGTQTGYGDLMGKMFWEWESVGLVDGLEHGFYFPFHIWNNIPIDFHIFQDA